MTRIRPVRLASAALAFVLALPAVAAAQGTVADYQRADALSDLYNGAAPGMAGPATWIGETTRFWYRVSVKGGHQFMVYDVATREKRPAFDHEKLAAGLAKATGEEYKPLELPFSTFTFTNKETAVDVRAAGDFFTCSLTEYTCRKNERASRFGRRRADDGKPRVSPDGKWEAFIDNFNVAIRPVGGKELTHLSLDGSEGDPYELGSIAWSPDSTKLAAYRVKPGYHREVHYIESSPSDQIQPKYTSRFYPKPGDVLDVDQPVLFHVDPAAEYVVDRTLFPNAYSMSDLVWRKDGRAFTFEYNQRGHQVYRVIEVDAATGRARALVDEEAKTFFDYRRASGSLSDSGRKFRYDVADGKEIIWMSERDGWSHLYMYEGATGQVKYQITKGPWMVRAVQKVDEEKREIWFSASGMYPGQDPYFLYYYRIDFDGTGLVRLTDEEAYHQAGYSHDMQYIADTYSRVDRAPVLEVRRTSDKSLVATVERGDLAALEKTGWKPPEVFVAKGRDGKTDIWGVIFRPTNLDPKKKYPVIENIYAGPQGSFVPKTFRAYSSMRSLAELGFIVVQIDGMGTANRSKSFHDVAWKNLGDAGLPDRILWHKAVAAKYPYYDISRVGIYGTSAGGQSSLGALLFHPEFYKVAVSASGCHDNRMDKIWWNEQWMGWPIGPQYSASSNVDNAWRLQGDVLLIVGEMDDNVDPSSTMQVVSQFIKHDKNFDLLYIPGARHTSGGEFGEHKRRDFFVQHLLGVTPPRWSELDKKADQ